MRYFLSVWHLSVAAVLFFCSCDENFKVPLSFDLPKYEAAVQSGFVVMPETLQIEELFGEADHFITHYGFPQETHTWNSEVYFYGRYVLTMQAKVQMDKEFRRVEKVVVAPVFYLNEIRSVDFDHNGQIGCRYGGTQTNFGIDKWHKLYKAKGDFSVLGLKVVRDQPVKDVDKLGNAVRKNRVRVRPKAERNLSPKND